jgi:hypothetical protein
MIVDEICLVDLFEISTRTEQDRQNFGVAHLLAEILARNESDVLAITLHPATTVRQSV